MEKFNVYEAKTQLSSLLERAAAGKAIVICRRNVPVAELRALPRARRQRRPVGLARDGFSVPDTFFEPLPASVLRSSKGR